MTPQPMTPQPMTAMPDTANQHLREHDREQSRHAFRKRLCLAGLCVLVVGMFFWRAHLWERVPGFDERNGQFIFGSENALQYRYLKMIAAGKALPENDRRAQYPEGIAVYRDLALGMEYVEGLLYRIMGLRMPLWTYVRWPIAAMSIISIIAVYACCLLLWRSHAAALVSACLYAMHFPAFGRTIASYSREHFALPFILAGFSLIGIACEHHAQYRRCGLILAHLGGACWAMALCTWHVSRFAFLIMTGYLILHALIRPRCSRTARVTAVMLAWCMLAAILHPMLRARWFILSTPMLAGACLVAWDRLSGNLPVMTRRLVLPGSLLAAALISHLIAGNGAFSHVSSLFFAKLTHPLGPPQNPTGIPFEARVLWNEAFFSPNLFVMLYGYLPLMLPGLAGAGLMLMQQYRERRWDHAWLPYALIVFGAGFLMVNRMGVFWSFFLAIAVGRLFSNSRAQAFADIHDAPGARPPPASRRGIMFATLAVMPLLALEAFQTWNYRLPDNAYKRIIMRVARPLASSHLPGGGNEFRRVVSWIRRSTRPNDAIAAEFGASPTILLATGRPIVLQPKFETAHIRDKVRAYFAALFSSEDDFFSWCEKYRAAYVITMPETALLSGPGFPAWIAGHTRTPANSAAFLLHFFPGKLRHFELAYQNSRYRIYRVLSAAARPRHVSMPYQQPIFDPAFFHATPNTPPTPEATAKCLGRIIRAETMLRMGNTLFMRGKLLAARDILIRALHLHPGLPMARTLVARMALAVGRKDAALAAAQKGVKNDPDLPEAWAALAAARSATGDMQGAITAANKARNLNQKP